MELDPCGLLIPAIMIQLTQPVAFDDFIEWYPEHTGHRYELHRGAIVSMPKPKGKHSEIAGLLGGLLFLHLNQQKLPYFIPRECIVRISDNTGYEPDVIVLDTVAVQSEPEWDNRSVITQGSSVGLVIEVVSSNWRDDYYMKFSDYEAIGIPEYWIVDYAALGGRKFIGNPKHPTVSVCTLVDGEYQVKKFQSQDKIQSLQFPELNLTVTQAFGET